MPDILAGAHVTADSHVNKLVQDVRDDVVAPPSVVPHHAIASLVELARSAPKRGCIVEVGVYKGGTAFHLAKVARENGVKLYLYDTFEGIPYTNKEKGDQHNVGDFSDTTMVDVVSAIPDAVVIKGIFPDSYIPMPQIAFAHIDADQYDSIIGAIKALDELMMSGGIIVFDDYGALEGATAAVNEMYAKYQIEITTAGKAMVRYS